MASPVLSFTSLDYDSLKDEIQKWAQEKYGAETWTDFNEDQYAVIFLEMMAYVGDMMAFQINALVKESIVVLLSREQNLRNIAKSLDYTVPSASAATGKVQLTLDSAQLPYTIPATFQFGNDDPDNQVIFQPIAAILLTVTPSTIDVVEGEGIYGESVGTSDGTQNQAYPLASSPLIDRTLTVSVAAVPWTQITNFATVGPLDLAFIADTDEDDVTTLRFGDGVNGAVPPSGQSITATYKIGGGSRGNLAKNTITELVTPSNVILSVNNSVATSGGGPKPTVTESKNAIPASLVVLDRAVANQDYASLAVELPGVAKAYSEANPNNLNQVNLFIAPQGGGIASNVLKNSVIVGLKDKRMAVTRLNIGDPAYPAIMMTIDLYVKSNAKQSDVLALVQNAILSDLSFDNVDFGGVIVLQNIYLLLSPDNINGLDKIVVRQLQLRATVRRTLNQANTGNPTFPYIKTTKNIGTYTWLIRVTATFGFTHLNVSKVYRGTVSGLSDTTLTDQTGTFEDGELIGLGLVPNEVSPSSLYITGNTDTEISVSGGLLNATSDGDTYNLILENVGEVRMVNTVLTAAFTSDGSSPLPLASIDNLYINDRLVFTNPTTGAVLGITSISSIDLTHVYPNPDDSLSLPSGSVVSTIYRSTDQSFEFSMVAGTNPVAVGDNWFIDTTAQLGDIPVRSSDIPQLSPVDLNIRVIGGIVS